MLYISSMFIGPLRLVFFVIFIYIIKQLISFRRSNQRGLDYFITRIVMFLSVIIIVSMGLTQFNAFDLLVCLSILFGFMILVFLNLNSKIPLRFQFLKMRKRLLIYTVRNFEKHQKLVRLQNLEKKIDITKTKEDRTTAIDYMWQNILAVFIALLTFFSRFYFFNFDTFTLSDLWYQKIENITDLTQQNWFFHEGTMMGEYLVMNVYAGLTGITNTIALKSFGLIESSLLAVILFWFTYKLTSKKLIPALVTSLSFTLLYPLLPLNINLISQHKSIFLALVLGLPAIMYTLNPTSLRKDLKVYMRWMFYLFSAIFLIDLFVAIFIVFPFVVIISILNFRRDKAYLTRSLGAYFAALLVVFLIHLAAAYVLNYDLIQFINSNLYSYTSYTYTPQLILPWEELVIYYQVASLACLLISILLYIKSPNRFSGSLALAVFLNIFLNSYRIKNLIVDIDLLNETSAVFIPLLFGLSLFLLFSVFEVFSFYVRWNFNLKAIISTIVISVLFISFARNTIDKIPFRKNLTKEQIIEAYNEIDSKHLPYSYGVVNTQNNSVISEDSHYFISYDYFNNSYLKKDSIYAIHKASPDYFKQNPESVLPASTFVFVYDEKSKLIKNQALQNQVKNNIERLKAKGREIYVFYDGSLVKVYEIVNLPRQSNIKELLY